MRTTDRISPGGMVSIFNLNIIIEAEVKGMYDNILIKVDPGFCIALIANIVGRIRIMLI